MTPSLARWSPLGFLLVAGAVYAAALGLVLPRLALTEHPGALAAALTLDLTVLVPAAYYGLLVRGRGWPVVTVLPVLVASVLAAAHIVPEAYHGTLHAVEAGALVVEAGILALVVLRLRRVARAYRAASGDPYERLGAALGAALGAGTATRLMAYELAVIRYAVRGWRERPAAGFGGWKASGYASILTGIGAAAVVELVGVHFLLAQWSGTAAAVHLALSGYALVWLIGDAHALRLRATAFRDGALHVRVGLRWQGAVPVEAVERLLRVRGAVEKAPGLLIATPFGDPTHLLELNRPVPLQGPYGITRTVTTLGLALDDGPGFEAALAGAIAVPEERLPETGPS